MNYFHFKKRGDMKLVLCSLCHDVFKVVHKQRFCKCKKSYGILSDNLKSKCQIAIISPDGIPFALDNNYLLAAITNWKADKRTTFIHGWSVDPTQKINDVIIKNVIKKECKK